MNSPHKLKCNENKELYEDKCYKKCNENQERNHETKRCRKKCKEDEEKNDKGKCVKINPKTQKVCPQGKILNPETQKCVLINGKKGKQILKDLQIKSPRQSSTRQSSPPRQSPPRQSPPRQSPPRQSPPRQSSRQSPPRQSPPRQSPRQSQPNQYFTNLFTKIESDRKNLLCDKCSRANTFQNYINNRYNINIIGMAQPIRNFKTCIDLLIENNVKYYITFNEIEFPLETIEEKKFFNCDDCKILSIPIADYTAPTKRQLEILWEVLDEFHEKKRKNNEINLVMHCTAGTGRTPVMIISYLMYKMLQNSNEYQDDFRLIRNIIDNKELYFIFSNFLTKKEIEKTKTYKYIYSEINNKYSNIACQEVFNGYRDDDDKLFIDRMKIIIDSLII